MGGHGALISALSKPEKYSSASALAPICNPMKSKSIGPKIFWEYLGSIEAGAKYDATMLISAYEGPFIPIFID